MYRIRYSHPITGKECSRVFKTLKAAYRFIRDLCHPMTFEVIPIGTSQEYYVYYDLFEDEFIINFSDEIQESRKLVDVNE